MHARRGWEKEVSLWGHWPVVGLGAAGKSQGTAFCAQGSTAQGQRADFAFSPAEYLEDAGHAKQQKSVLPSSWSKGIGPKGY